MAVKRGLKPVNPLLLAELDEADAYAIKALNLGTATPEQQRYALYDVILKKFCQFGEVSITPGEPEMMFFYQGKRSVGKAILDTIAAPMAVFQPPPPAPQRRTARSSSSL